VCYAAVVDQVLELILDERKSVEEAEGELKLRYRKRIWA